MRSLPSQVRIGGIACQYAGAPRGSLVGEECHIRIVAYILVTSGAPACAEFQVVDDFIVLQE